MGGCCSVRAENRNKQPASGCMTLGPEQLLIRQALLRERSAQDAITAERVERERTGTEVSLTNTEADASDCSEASIPDFRAAFGLSCSPEPVPRKAKAPEAKKKKVKKKVTRGSDGVSSKPKKAKPQKSKPQRAPLESDGMRRAPTGATLPPRTPASTSPGGRSKKGSPQGPALVREAEF